MFKSWNIVFLLAVLFTVLSCDKNETDSIPVIEMESPVENQLFGVVDTIRVRANISDERLIANIQVVLVNEGFIPVAMARSFQPNSSSYNLDINYYLEDSTLESGNYYILVKAENETRFKNKYTKIRLAGEAERLREVIVVTGNGEHITVSRVDSSQTVSPFFSVDCNYAASAVSGKYNHFYLAGKTIISLRAYSMQDNSVEWNVPPVVSPPIHNNNCLYADEYVFATYNSLYIRGYDDKGSVVFTTNITSHDKPGAVISLNDYLLVDMQKQNTAAVPELVTYYVQSGLKKQERETQFEVSGFFRYSDDKVFIAANNGDTGQLYIYDIKYDAIEYLAGLPGRIESADLIDSERVIIGTENDLYIYNYSTLQLISFANDIAVDIIRFESLNGDLYISSGKELKRFQFPAMQLKNTYSFEDTIKNVHLLYNK